MKNSVLEEIKEDEEENDISSRMYSREAIDALKSELSFKEKLSESLINSLQKSPSTQNCSAIGQILRNTDSPVHFLSLINESSENNSQIDTAKSIGGGIKALKAKILASSPVPKPRFHSILRKDILFSQSPKTSIKAIPRRMSFK